MLILVGVTLSTLSGQDGILNKAATAAEETEKAKNEEQRKMATFESAMNTDLTYFQGVPIPAGFAPTRIEGESTVKEGLVITDEEGNEFVWIPIDKKKLTVVGTDKEMAELAADEKNYRGVLYNFDGIISNKINYNANSNREPDILTACDTDEQGYLKKIGLTQETFNQEMQDNYNAMIKSVQTYEGFYVGRYETSYENGKVQSKSGKIPMSASDDNEQMWYGMYDKQKKYASNNEIDSVVGSSMIWGSQYDAMLNYALTNDKDKVKVTAKTNAEYNLKKPLKTGETPDDKILNIYDLEGNLCEWTLEANSTNARIGRGGNCWFGRSPSGRVVHGPQESKDAGGYCSRLTLYIL